MNVYAWIVIGFLALASLASIYSIGRPRKAFTPGNAVVAVLLNALVGLDVVLAVLR